MGRLTVDTTEARSFDPATPGVYPMLVDAIGDPQKGEKSTYVNVTFSFTDPALDKKHGKVFRNYPVNGKGAGFFRDFWKAATGEDIPVGEAGIDVDTDMAIGRQVTVQIGNREYEGRLQNEVEKVAAA